MVVKVLNDSQGNLGGGKESCKYKGDCSIIFRGKSPRQSLYRDITLMRMKSVRWRDMMKPYPTTLTNPWRSTESQNIPETTRMVYLYH
jgi:hypothetical protein